MRRIMTIPNILSIIRILLIPVNIWLLLTVTDETFFALIGVYVFTVFLDFLDGLLARKLSQESQLGAALDPIADKLLVLALLIALVVRADFPIWLAGLIILRDLLILAASAVIYRGKQVVKPSLLSGKITFAIFSTLIFVYIVNLHSEADLTYLKHFLTIISFSFLMWSFSDYLQVYLRERQGR
jgi:CDP-diacylglycerol--glycerol-3-phosphate 3-phosphatidyltransferase